MKNIKLLHLLLIILAFSLLTASFSCGKNSPEPQMVVYGYVKSKTNGEALPKMIVDIYILKGGKGMGIINGSRTDYGGQGKTNSMGYFEVKIKLFKGAESLEIFTSTENEDFGNGLGTRFVLSGNEKQEVELIF